MPLETQVCVRDYLGDTADSFTLDTLLDLLDGSNDNGELCALSCLLDEAEAQGEPLFEANVTAPALARIPKKAAPRPRVSYARDLRKLSIFKGFEPDMRKAPGYRSGVPLVDEPVDEPPTLTPTPSTSLTPSQPVPAPTLSQTTQKRRKAEANDKRSAPAWNRTTDVAKAHAFVRTVSTTGGGLSWTLNLGGKMLQAANDNPATIKQTLHDRLDKALKATFGTGRDFVFAIEATKDGRWHAHGALDAAVDERPVAEQALRRAGGTWGSERHSKRQAHTDVLWGPDGWMRYVLKDMAATKRRLGIKSVLSVTRGCRARAEELWTVSRRASATK